MSIISFDQLLRVVREHPEPRRLLLVFAGASLPGGATDEQRALFEAGEGGELSPLMCVDKDPHALGDFEALAAEAQALGPSWSLVFAAALAAGAAGPPTVSQVDAALQDMVQSVHRGDIGRFLPFDRMGCAVQLG